MNRVPLYLCPLALLIPSCSRSPEPRRDVEPHVVLEFRLVGDSRDRASPFTIVLTVPKGPERVYTELPEDETVKMTRRGRESSRFREELQVHNVADLQIMNADIALAQARFGGRGFEVYARLTESGSRKIADFTRENVGRQIAIMFEGEVYSAPVIMSEISGSIVVSGNPADLTEEDAARIAAVLSGRGDEADSEKWLPRKPSRSAMIALHVTKAALPYLVIACLLALLLTRLRWVASLAAAVVSALVYRLGQGLYWHATLPSEEEWQRQLEDPASRVFALTDLFEGGGLVAAPPWADILHILLIQMVFAVAGGLLGIGLAWLLLRSRRVNAWTDAARERLREAFGLKRAQEHSDD